MSQIKIHLSDTCKNQEVTEANSTMLGMYKEGMRYHFMVPSPKKGEVRIAFAGDSVTGGCCATDPAFIE